MTEYVADGREFVRRTGFVLMAVLAVHDKEASDERFLEWLKVVEAYAWDGRNFVKKAVNWALRQIGKRNERLRLAAVEVAGRLAAADDAAARWVGATPCGNSPHGGHWISWLPIGDKYRAAVGKRFCRGGTAADSVPEADIQTVRTSRCR